MAKWTTIVALLLLLVAPSGVLAQSGYYGWSISASNTNPFDNNPPNPGAGAPFLYLWYLGGCYPGPPGSEGVSAAEFRIVSANCNWSVLAFTPMNGFLNASTDTPGATGFDLLLATACTSTSAIVAGSIIMSADGSPGKVGLGLSNLNGIASGVDCVLFQEQPWPAKMRFVGYATQDAGAPQDHGNDCTTTSVNAETWGKVKSLYH